MIFPELSSFIQIIEISFFNVIHPEKKSVESEMETRAENLCPSPKNFVHVRERVSEAIAVNTKSRVIFSYLSLHINRYMFVV